MNEDLFFNAVNFECHKSSLREGYQEILKQTFFDVLSMLQVDISNFKEKFPGGKINVKFGNFDSSSAEGNTIYIALKPSHGHLTDNEWFELIFTHEFIHTVVEFCWGGICAPLFWEGLPVYLADNRLKKQASGISYHQFCKSLMEKSLLIDLNHFLGTEYYEKRQDWRIDLQAGSFMGFLIEEFNIQNVRALFKNYKPPTPKHPVLNINSLLTETFGYNLADLQLKWREFLEISIEIHPDAEQRAITYVPTTTQGKKRCGFCYSRREIEDVFCKSCKAPTDIKIMVD